jgi:hypothetical protein
MSDNPKAILTTILGCFDEIIIGQHCQTIDSLVTKAGGLVTIQFKFFASFSRYFNAKLLSM